MRRDESGGGSGAHAKQRCSSLITRCVQMRAFALLAVAVQTVTAAPAQFEAESDWPPPPRGWRTGGVAWRAVAFHQGGRSSRTRPVCGTPARLAPSAWLDVVLHRPGGSEHRVLISLTLHRQGVVARLLQRGIWTPGGSKKSDWDRWGTRSITSCRIAVAWSPCATLARLH